MRECWRPIELDIASFEVSNLGRVREPKTGLIRKLADHDGYRRLSVQRNRVRKFYAVHRMIAKAFLPNPDGLPFVNHKNADPSDNRVCNLEWCTFIHNMRHAWQNGLITSLPGSENPAAKLTEKSVIQIRKIYATGARQVDLANRYGVSQRAISLIVRREKWCHV